MEVSNLLTFTERRQLREWFEQNHLSEKCCWVACNRSMTPKPDSLPYLEIVEEALCFGWIDSTLKKLPDGRLVQRLSPRRKGSHWTELNKERCRDLESRGLMTDAGRKVFGEAIRNVNRIIREAQPSDMADIMHVMDAAKKIMRQSGNMHQWGEGYPSEAVITADMEKNGGFVIEDNGKVVGYFAFLPSPEPTYYNIYKGKWLNDTQPYHVVHRIASYPDAHGIFASIMEYCFSHDPNIRIDTHRDNKIMQHNILKHGFTYCGIIYLTSGDERLAYQKYGKD